MKGKKALAVGGLLLALLLMGQDKESTPEQNTQIQTGPDPDYIRFLYRQCRRGDQQACEALAAMGFQPPPPPPPKLPPGVGAIAPTGILRERTLSFPGASPELAFKMDSTGQYVKQSPTIEIQGVVGPQSGNIQPIDTRTLHERATTVTNAPGTRTWDVHLDRNEHIVSKTINVGNAKSRKWISGSEVLKTFRIGSRDEVQELVERRNGRVIVIDSWYVFTQLSELLATVLLTWELKNKPVDFAPLRFFRENVFHYRPDVLDVIKAGMETYIGAGQVEKDWELSRVPLVNLADQPNEETKLYKKLQDQYKRALDPKWIDARIKNGTLPEFLAALQFPADGRSASGWNGTERWAFTPRIFPKPQFIPAQRFVLSLTRGQIQDIEPWLSPFASFALDDLNNLGFNVQMMPPPLSTDRNSSVAARTVHVIRQAMIHQMFKSCPATYLWERAIMRFMAAKYFSKLGRQVAEIGFGDMNADFGAFFAGMASAMTIAASSGVGSVVAGAMAIGTLISQLVGSANQMVKTMRLERIYQKNIGDSAAAVLNQAGIPVTDLFFARHWFAKTLVYPVGYGEHAEGLYENSYLMSESKNLFNLYFNPSPFRAAPPLMYLRINYDVPMGIAKASATAGDHLYAQRMASSFHSTIPTPQDFPDPMLPFCEIIRAPKDQYGLLLNFKPSSIGSI